MLIRSVGGVVEPSHWQFYLLRGRAEWRSDQVSPGGYETHLESIGGFVYVGTWSYGTPTSVTIELHDAEPALVNADHVVEVPLEGDGPIALLNWDPDDAPVAVVEAPPGPLALRGSWTGLHAVEEFQEPHTADGRVSSEMIRLQVWPSAVADAKVLVVWPEDS